MDENRWVWIGNAPNESLAMMVEGLLRGENIPVLIQRSQGFDVPEFLAAGPRVILVPGWAEPEAREIVEDTVGYGGSGVKE